MQLKNDQRMWHNKERAQYCNLEMVVRVILPIKKKNILIFEIYDREINFLTGSVLIKRCQTSSTLAHFQNKIILTITDSKNRIILGTGMMLNLPLAILSKL